MSTIFKSHESPLQQFNQIASKSTTLPKSVVRFASATFKPIERANGDEILNDQRFIDAREHIYKVHDFSNYDLEFLKDLVSHLKLYCQLHALEGNYQVVDKYSKVRNEVVNEIKFRIAPRPVTASYNQYEDKKKAFEEKWAQIFAEFDEETEKRLFEIKEKHRQESQDLKNEWETHQQERYRRPSAQLIKQRQLEEAFILKDELTSAAHIHKIVLQLEEEEFKFAQIKFFHDFKFAEEFLEHKHKQETKNFLYARNNARDLLEKDQRKEGEKFIYRIVVLNSKSAKVPFSKPRETLHLRPTTQPISTKFTVISKKLPQLHL